MKKRRIALVRDWSPRNLPGGIYCSPACGGACSRADHDRANADATALATRMGDGWGPEVWENLGWHWRITNGAFTMYEDRDGKYSAWFDLTGITKIIVEAATPKDALGLVRQDARTLIRRIEDHLADTI